MSWTELSGSGLQYSASPWDSRRFGVTVGRVVVGHGTTRAAGVADQLRRVLADDVDVLVVRYPARLTELASVLAASVRQLLVADSLVYWDADCDTLASSAPAPGRLAVSRGSIDPATFEATVRATFASYRNHYSVNPLFPADQALAGYVEWAGRAADSGEVAVLRDGDDVIGFATWSVDPLGHTEIELAGIVPGARDRGAYGLLLAEVGRASAEQGQTRVVISTQAGNVRVQRAWHRAGMAPFATFTTLHAVRPHHEAAAAPLEQ